MAMKGKFMNDEPKPTPATPTPPTAADTTKTAGAKPATPVAK